MNSLDISMKALEVARHKLNVLAENIANSENPNYKRKEVILSKRDSFDDVLNKISYPEIVSVKEKDTEYVLRFDPQNPQADENGFVKEPIINPVEDMINLIEISRYYEANLAVIEATRSMNANALNIGR
ncbi:MAG: flagellar basal body rod protein FlgC [Elusimicrobiales bacterium]|nr:flagellar basal body rod protein FlgC [Elusimicrobiales bacterium]